MAIIFKVSGAGVAREFLGASADRAGDLGRPLRWIGEEMLARTQLRMRAGTDIHGRPFTPSKRVSRDGGQTLWNRGALAASANYSVSGDTLELFSSDVRARIHNEGGTILPKKAKWLTIPLRAVGGYGKTTDVAASPNRSGRRARDYKNTFFRRRGNKLFLCQTTESGAVRVLFLLVRSVRIPKREWLGFGADDEAMAIQKIGEYVAPEEK